MNQQVADYIDQLKTRYHRKPDLLDLLHLIEMLIELADEEAAEEAQNFTLMNGH